jgi:hypothetical protein
MTEIRISPLAQVIMLVALLAGIAAAIFLQLPEIRRYLKIEAM